MAIRSSCRLLDQPVRQGRLPQFPPLLVPPATLDLLIESHTTGYGKLSTRTL